MSKARRLTKLLSATNGYNTTPIPASYFAVCHTYVKFDLENTVGMSVFWSLPNEYRPMSAAIDSGNPVVLDSPRSRLTRSYHELASTLADGIPLTDESQPQASASR